MNSTRIMSRQGATSVSAIQGSIVSFRTAVFTVFTLLIVLVGTPSETVAQNIPVRYERIAKKRARYYDISVRYPVFGGSSSVARFANKFMHDEETRSVKQFIEHSNENAKENWDFCPSGFVLKLEPTVAVARPNLISLYLTGTIYGGGGGAGHAPSFISDSFGVVNGKVRRLSLSDLFAKNVDPFVVLSAVTLPKLRAAGAWMVEEGMVDKLDKDRIRSWVVGPDGITLLFGPGNVGSNADNYVVKIGFNEMGNALDKNGPLKDLFPKRSAPKQKPTIVPDAISATATTVAVLDGESIQLGLVSTYDGRIYSSDDWSDSNNPPRVDKHVKPGNTFRLYDLSGKQVFKDLRVKSSIYEETGFSFVNTFPNPPKRPYEAPLLAISGLRPQPRNLVHVLVSNEADRLSVQSHFSEGGHQLLKMKIIQKIVVDLDGDGTEEVLFVADAMSNGATERNSERYSVIALRTSSGKWIDLNSLYRTEDEIGFYRLLGVPDVDGDGKREIVLFAAGEGPHEVIIRTWDGEKSGVLGGKPSGDKQ